MGRDGMGREGGGGVWGGVGWGGGVLCFGVAVGMMVGLVQGLANLGVVGIEDEVEIAFHRVTVPAVGAGLRVVVVVTLPLPWVMGFRLRLRS